MVTLTPKDKAAIEKAKHNAYVKEKKRIETKKAREKARRDSETLTEKTFKFLKGLISD
jgi:hypothetical protein